MFLTRCSRTFTRAVASFTAPRGVSSVRAFSAAVQPGAPGGYMQTGSTVPEDAPIRILVTGALGQIGTEIVPFLREKYGVDNVIASDIKTTSGGQFEEGPYVHLDVLNRDNLAAVLLENRIDWVIHFASMLSAVGEQNPQLAMKLNTRGIENVLETAKDNNLRVFAPSTIAVFGPSSPKDAPDLTVMRPTTMYGVTKVYLELLGEYYHNKFGVDFRSIRYPGIISSAAQPGGGTTDYAVEIYHEALKNEKYTCFLNKDSMMPMMYMPDCIKATVSLLEAPSEILKQRTYNVTGFSFTPEELGNAIVKEIPNFELRYKPDFRQAIADTWPRTLDDSNARKDWGWQHDYDIDTMTKDMLDTLRPLYEESAGEK